MSARERAKEKTTKDSLSLLPCFYFVELPILVSSVASLYFLEWTDIFKPVHWGFSCFDRSLSLPYIEPTHEIIPFLMLFILTIGAPAVTIMIGEGILFCWLSKTHSGPGPEANINAAGCNFNSYIRRAIRFVGVHVFGLCATALITDIIQLSTGYPAPYFLTVCKPNYTYLNSSCDENSFILEDICSGTDTATINAGRKSFPSQHATLASFAAVYISMYFNSTLTDSSKLLKPLLVFSFIISAIICGLTRIIQHKNHAIDVYLGFLLGGGIAIYLGLHAVGNFQPSEEKPKSEPQVQDTVTSLGELGQHVGHHLPAKSRSSSDGLSSSHSDGLLHRNLQTRHTRSLTNLKRSSADVEVPQPHSPADKESMVTFSNTLPRIHPPTIDDGTRLNGAVHSTLDSSRSKQLLSQWKSKNENRKHFMQAVEAALGQCSVSSMETRCSSEPSTIGINGEQQGPAGSCLKLATGSSTLPSNPCGIAGGTRMSVQSRPGSSQLVHIPEETQEGMSTSPRGIAQDKWLKSMEKNVNGQPRVVPVIGMSKQHGLLLTGSSSSESSHTSSTAPLHRNKILSEEPGSGATTQGSIVRVEAHPENGRPLVHAHSTDSTTFWTWKSQNSLRQSFELNDLNRDSENCDSLKDGYGSTDRTRSNSVLNTCHSANSPAVSSISTLTNSVGEPHPHQTVSTIRVTPIESTETGPESRDSTLRRKSNMILIPERGNSPDNTRTIFYKGTSTTPAFKE
ncbi:LOW QUALITY PROTEIN: phospholipid phosphatase-related protein type 4 [Silurus meridionalis]|uniref:LOW QUALITY PROTEIN: phospholipid phosphatase-related protein type 4 n=1 Tax=Silurus meridionalis TaxID=175797 RepID=UPI001EEB5360|nr:LOW QUALITY PROTEIN: phospholipid phosphatase-related protein type 4 [Silurus meridionalis]